MSSWRLSLPLVAVLSCIGCAPPSARLPISQLEALRHQTSVDQPPLGKISYLRAGATSGPVVIFVHGTPGQANGWSDYVLQPETGVEVFAIDRPGFGHSAPDGPVTSLVQQARAVVQLFPADGRPVVLVGHSLGGAVVSRVAAEHPDRVKALVLLASSLDPGQEKIHPLQPLGRYWPFNAMLPREMFNANEELMLFKAELGSLKPLLKNIVAPTMIVHGTKDDLVPFANVAYVQKELTAARCIKTMVLEGQNHFLPWNSEATVREAVRWAIKPECPVL